MTAPQTILGDGDGWLIFECPIETRVAVDLDEVIPLLEWAESQAETRWVVGYVAYEAAPAFDAALSAHRSGVPLAQFSVFDEPVRHRTLPPPPIEPWGIQLSAGISEEEYLSQAGRVLGMIGEGRVYQVNLTHPYVGNFWGDPSHLFRAVAEIDASPYAAFVPGDAVTIASFSPELFFERNGPHVRCKPMKGTRAAGTSAAELKGHPKDQAENLMIVDMIRNDLGRLAGVGTVETSGLFAVEQHGTVLQMTSTVEADIGEAPTLDLFRALFPCASVVGAPKVEATRAIAELESGGRGIYCGAIGFMAPGRRARFNVAIRTLVFGKDAEYRVGSGVVWDSDPREEWRECQIKTRVLASIAGGWRSLETLRWSPGEGFVLLREHMARLIASRTACGLDTDIARIQDQLAASISGADQPKKVRLLVAQDGRVEVETVPLGHWPENLRAAIAGQIDSSDPWLRHKTTFRRVYDQAWAQHPDFDEILLINERGELCEFTVGNLVIERDGAFLTPPIDCGVLPGVQRGLEITIGTIREAVLTLEDLRRAEAVWHLNSVRGWTRVKITLPTEAS